MANSILHETGSLSVLENYSDLEVSASLIIVFHKLKKVIDARLVSCSVRIENCRLGVCTLNLYPVRAFKGNFFNYFHDVVTAN